MKNEEIKGNDCVKRGVGAVGDNSGQPAEYHVIMMFHLCQCCRPKYLTSFTCDSVQLSRETADILVRSRKSHIF